jgi:hypothetical protein
MNFLFMTRFRNFVFLYDRDSRSKATLPFVCLENAGRVVGASDFVHLSVGICDYEILSRHRESPLGTTSHVCPLSSWCITCNSFLYRRKAKLSLYKLLYYIASKLLGVLGYRTCIYSCLTRRLSSCLNDSVRSLTSKATLATSTRPIQVVWLPLPSVIRKNTS